ncbi:MAG: choice-of-anchor tandem repeat GloVer-containing protein, partial [Thermosynechococcaceae cyanobacterium]
KNAKQSSQFLHRNQQALSVNVIGDFNGKNGSSSYATLVQGKDGNFYGTSRFGGYYNKGTIFYINSKGKMIVVASFKGFNGAYPYAGLIKGEDGKLYGTTLGGGNNKDCPVEGGCGTIFSLNYAGKITTLFSFSYLNGIAPAGVLLEDKNGDLYGTTQSGGSYARGTIFRLTRLGYFTTLIEFNGHNHSGANPIGGLVQAKDGNFYGTTSYGGLLNSGTLFRINRTGILTTLVFFSSETGSNPTSKLIQARDGNFYGTTVYGGAYKRGTVFRLTPSGKITNLIDFSGINGAYPYAELVQDSEGNFYGTTQSGGTYRMGSVFRLTSLGKLTTIVSFHGDNGSAPYASLTQVKQGHFYGTTSQGGSKGFGRVFDIVLKAMEKAQ